MNPRTHDIGAYIKAVIPAITGVSIASSTASGVEINGHSFDRLGETYLYRSGVACFGVAATLAAAATVSVVANFQDSTNASTWADYGSTYASVVLGATDSTAAQTVRDCAQFDVDLGAARRYVRVQVTPTLSDPTSTSDVVTLSGILVVGGPPVLSSTN